MESGKSILVVHDAFELAKSVCAVLGVGKFECKIIDSRKGAEAILLDEKYWNACVGVVIDIGLEDGENAGWDLAQWIRQKELSRPGNGSRRKYLVGLTGHPERFHYVTRTEVFDEGFLTPYAPATLLKTFVQNV